jgi:hypothetical protein
VATFDYADIAATVVEMLAEFGEPLTLVRNDGGGGGTYDPDTSTVVDSPEATHTANAIQVQLESEMIDGTLIQANDRRFLIAPDLGLEPAPGDAVTYNARTFAVVSCQPMMPAGVPLAYDVIARGA